MKRYYFVLLLCTAISFCTTAQIGYQVSLLNNATGEARANEQVTVTVKITDSAGKTICEETKNETSNDFGVLSISVGDNETFTKADWSKLPFFIEASIDGRLLGKSQLLSVPVAEHAKHTGLLTIDILCAKTWSHYFTTEYGTGYDKYDFDENGSFTRIHKDSHSSAKEEFSNGHYFIEGNDLIAYYEDWSDIFKYNPTVKRLFGASNTVLE